MRSTGFLFINRLQRFLWGFADVISICVPGVIQDLHTNTAGRFIEDLPQPMTHIFPGEFSLVVATVSLVLKI